VTVSEFLAASDEEAYAPLAAPQGYTLAPAPWIQLEFDIPPGAKRDKTRNPGFYEGVSEYLTDLGVPQV
jgi:hypothetical protein